jgi:hypothetical protein
MKIRRLATLALLLACRMSAAHSQQLSNWTHNGSIMALTFQGDEIRITYIQPRTGMSQAGARVGSLLLNARLTGTEVYGTARIFAWQCGTFAYPVHGELSREGARITLRGMAPVIDRGTCTQRSEILDILHFDLIAGAPVPFLKRSDDW